MAKRIELPDGQFIEVKEVSELNAGDRRAVKGAVPMRVDPDTKEMSYPGDYNEQMHNALAARIITSWNLQWPIPRGNPAVLDKLTMAQIDALYDGIEEHVKVLSPPKSDGDEADPTGSGSAT